MNETQLKQILPRAPKDLIHLNTKTGSPQKGPIPECATGDESMAKDKGEKRDPRSRAVRIESRRRRLIDPGANLWGGTKYFEDALRYAGILYDDSANFIEPQVSQTKVETEEEEATIIEIDIPK